MYAAEQDRSSVERLTLIGDLPDAVSLDQFELHFQPCVDLRTGIPVRAEALEPIALERNRDRAGRALRTEGELSKLGQAELLAQRRRSEHIEPVRPLCLYRRASTLQEVGHE